jgi:hypothetical protein
VEALLLGRPIIVLGDAFYTACPLLRRAQNALNLKEYTAKLLRHYEAPQETMLIDYLCRVWSASSAGELYVTNAKNIKEFCSSLIDRAMLI